MGEDATAGTEHELQAVVAGKREHIDLPLTIEQSRYFENISRHAAVGESPLRTLTKLRRYLEENESDVWENSWVRFPERTLSSYALTTLQNDLRTHRRSPQCGTQRSDAQTFQFLANGEEWIRVPVSYVVKLALADVIGRHETLPSPIRNLATELMERFSNDNSSPETASLYVSDSAAGGIGASTAKEAAQRFLLTHLLVAWSNQQFELNRHGQNAMAYLAPHPPIRQKELNECISDSYYRELFMSPCLSGWDEGEIKRDYMHLCHQVLSRSQLNVIAKLRESGIIAHDLVVLPNTSNVSLANNGMHLSLGSKRIRRCLADASSGFGADEEKCIGDLVVKIAEHFLPLFVGTFSAAPYRFGFTDFHPEKILGFLPHELDYTHLRMLWRHWKRKAHLKVLGKCVTPYGPWLLDAILEKTFRPKGDVVPDFRLIDYPVAWLPTEASSSLDGTPDNVERLKCDLEHLGIFDRRMSLYMPIKLREFAKMGFSGFEARHFSLFPGFSADLAPAVDLQRLIYALAYQYLAEGSYSHAAIPDDPQSASERRQPFFIAALGLPVFYVRRDTPNEFMKRVLRHVPNLRPSHKHPKYLHVRQNEYLQALLHVLREDGRRLLEDPGFQEAIRSAEERLLHPSDCASESLTRDICAEIGSRSALSTDARDFNLAAERFYRETLRKRHLAEALQYLVADVMEFTSHADAEDRALMGQTMRVQDAVRFVRSVKDGLLSDRLSRDELRSLIACLLVLIHDNERRRWSSKKQTSVHELAKSDLVRAKASLPNDTLAPIH